MSDETLRRFLLRAAAGAAAAALFYLTARYLLRWALPFLIAFAAAAAMEPAVRFLQARLRFRRGFAAALLTLFLLFLLGGLLSLLGTTLLSEAYAFLERAPALLARVPEAFRALLARLERFGAAYPKWLRDYVERSLAPELNEAGSLLGTLAGQLFAALGSLAAALPRRAFGAATCVLAVYFTSAHYPALRALARRHLSGRTLRSLRLVRSGAARSLARWLRAEAALCAVTFCELLAALWLLRQEYALLLACLITLVDALPVFGTGTVLVPWALAELLFGAPPKAAALGALYLVTLLVRNVLEPRLLGAQTGLPPVVSLGAMYLGFCTLGVGGMILFPFLLLFAAQLRREARAAA